MKILFDMILFQLHNIIKLHKFLMTQNPKIHHFCLQHLNSHLFQVMQVA